MELAKGVRDFPPEKKIIRQSVVSVISRIFERYGFNPIETSIIERYETLASKYAGGAEILKETFKITDQGGRQLGLRYDLTVPFARYIAMNPKIKMPFKKYQIGEVFRDGPIKLGRYREFWQCDADVVGSKSLLTDAELINMAKDIFSELKIDVQIEVNDRKLLDSLLESAGVPKEKLTAAILIIDKLKKIGKAEVQKELDALEVDSGKILELLSLDINKLEVEGMAELKELLSYTEAKPVLSLSRGLAYYTGTVFEVYLKDGSFSSSLAAGGRYDRMITDFVGDGREYPAVGISFGLDTICDVIKKQEKQTIVSVYVIPISTNKESHKIVKLLRDNSVNADIDLATRGISKNLAYANYYGIPYVLIIGEDELKKGLLKLKNMKTGEELLVGIEEAIEKLKQKNL